MPNAIANSPSPFDVPDARTLRQSSSTSSVRIESSRFVEALQEAEREPSRKLEKKPLPPVDEPLDHARPHADDIELMASPAVEPPHHQQLLSHAVTAMAVSQDDRHTKAESKTDAKQTPDRLRRRTDTRATAAPLLPTTAAAKLAMRAAGSDALLQAVQHHVRVAVQNEARASSMSDERATKLHTPAPTTTPAPVPEAAAAPHEVVTEVQAVQTEQQVTSSTSSPPSSAAEPTAMGARENAALDHVQAIMEDPASQLFFDGRRAVLTIDGMTMRITSTGEGQASVEVTAVDAAAADRLQSHRGQLVDGLQQEGIALTKLDVAHDASASTSQDRHQRKDTPEPIDFDQPRQAVKPTTTTTTTTAATLRAGVIKA